MSKDKLDRFDIEQNIMNSWLITHDIDLLLEQLHDDNRFVGLSRTDADLLTAKLMGIRELGQMRFEKLWSVFETIVEEGGFTE
jgi:hypothetical protein